MSTGDSVVNGVPIVPKCNHREGNSMNMYAPFKVSDRGVLYECGTEFEKIKKAPQRRRCTRMPSVQQSHTYCMITPRLQVSLSPRAMTSNGRILHFLLLLAVKVDSDCKLQMLFKSKRVFDGILRLFLYGSNNYNHPFDL